MRVNEYLVISECVETGIDRGYRLAFKYVENPSEKAIKDSIHHEVMNEICEYFKFDFSEETQEI